MKTFKFLFIGILFTIVFSFSGLVLSSFFQVGALKPIALEEGEVPQPRKLSGIAEQGKEEYRKLGCMYCHSHQTRRKGFGADFERGWGDRATVARDYIYHKLVMLGTMRTGPDLTNVGQRLPVDDWHYLHFYKPTLTSPGSVMNPYTYLFVKQKISPKGPSPNALKFPEGSKETPEEGYEIVPTDRMRKLVAYLLSLRLDYELPEAKFSE